MGVCRSCGKTIEWTTTERGQKMPLDPDYVAYNEALEGDLLVTDSGKVITVDKHTSFPNLKGRISHFATCPDAKKWRKE